MGDRKLAESRRLSFWNLDNYFSLKKHALVHSTVAEGGRTFTVPPYGLLYVVIENFGCGVSVA